MSSDAEPSIKKEPTPEADPYLWLEDIEGERALNWVRRRNGHTLSALQSDPRFLPCRDEIYKQLSADDRIPFGSYEKGNIYNFWQDKNNVRGLYRRTTLDSYRSTAPCWRTILDVDALAAAEDRNWVFKGVIPLASGDPRTLVLLSIGGKDAVVTREFDRETGRFIKDGFVVPEGKVTAAWVDENRLLIGANFDAAGVTRASYPRRIRLWRRGTPLEQAEPVYEAKTTDTSADAASFLRDGRRYAIVTRNITMFLRETYLFTAEEELLQVPVPDSADIMGLFQGWLVIKPREEWRTQESCFSPGSLVLLDLELFLQTREMRTRSLYAPAANASVQGVAATRSRLYINLLEDVKSKLLQATPAGSDWRLGSVPLPDNGIVGITAVDGESEVLMFSFSSFLQPDQLYLATAATEEPSVIKSLPPRFDSSRYQVAQRFAASRDGVRIPYFLVAAKDVPMDGSTPVLQWGYGGFGLSQTPGYLPAPIQHWLAQGGAYVVANIRGGGEYGPAWHQAALKENRQKSYDDFIAVAEDLIGSGVTSPRRLSCMGGSNGGLLVGVMLTQRPDLFGAVICAVPLLDMMRYHKLLAGASWMMEFGDPDVPEERDCLRRFSPYQNVHADADYPPVFFTTSTKDDRVHPGHARKMAAKMMAQGHQVHYYENTEGGHGGAANQMQSAQIEALQQICLLRQLGGEEVSQPRPQ